MSTCELRLSTNLKVITETRLSRLSKNIVPKIKLIFQFLKAVCAHR